MHPCPTRHRAPMVTPGCTTVPRPTAASASTVMLARRMHPSPIEERAPTTQQGPMETPLPIAAVGSTTADGWVPGRAGSARGAKSSRSVLRARSASGTVIRARFAGSWPSTQTPLETRAAPARDPLHCAAKTPDRMNVSSPALARSSVLRPVIGRSAGPDSSPATSDAMDPVVCTALLRSASYTMPGRVPPLLLPGVVLVVHERDELVRDVHA